MTLNRYNPKRDKNEREIIDALADHGVKSWQLSARGLPDLLCLKDGRLFLVEVKGKGGKLTEAQRLFFAEFPDCPAYVVSDIKDVAIVSLLEHPQ